ncbi:glycoside hydrolase family 88 protein [Parabacteroides sp. OttesenSCG-928-G07]|nr:glycoside hydrolase family 88 protein [Parabacteroides sp. OttesenSCG-928-G07]
MKKTLLSFVFVGAILFSGCQSNKEEPLSSVIERGLSVATTQSLLMAKELEGQEGRLPKTLKPDGTLESSNYSWWCSGFFPGELWLLYENNPTNELRKYAEMYTARVEPAKKMTSTHDLGFMLGCSFGHGYRLTGNENYKQILLEGADSLATRYNDHIGLIRSWDWNRDRWQYPVIIDNMMNLEFFTWATKMTGDQKYAHIANSHAMKTMQHHFRPDYSTYHVISYDLETGQPHAKHTHQGYADESVWARGQAWGLYGFTAMYRETGLIEYLHQAKSIADFLISHPRMPEDKVMYWDFDAPDIPEAKRDASAAAIMASALIELSQLDKTSDSQKYLAFAEEQVRSLSSPEYLAEPGGNGLFTIKHCVGHLPGNSEVDVPLTYADYYYVEALIRLKSLGK